MLEFIIVHDARITRSVVAANADAARAEHAKWIARFPADTFHGSATVMARPFAPRVFDGPTMRECVPAKMMPSGAERERMQREVLGISPEKPIDRKTAAAGG